jgi:hypothetical protein
MLQAFENNLEFATIHCSFWIEKKVVEFIMIFHLLSHGCLMFDFEIIKGLFCILKIKNMIIVRKWLKQCMILFLVSL